MHVPVGCPSLTHPPLTLGNASQVQKPAQQHQAVATRETEPRGVRRQCLNEGPRIVEHPTERIDDDLRDRFGILPLTNQIPDDPGRPRHGQPTHDNHLIVRQPSDVDSHIRAPRLSARGNGELMHIRRQMPSVSSMRPITLTSTDPQETSTKTSGSVQGSPGQSRAVVTQIVTQWPCVMIVNDGGVTFPVITSTGPVRRFLTKRIRVAVDEGDDDPWA